MVWAFLGLLLVFITVCGIGALVAASRDDDWFDRDYQAMRDELGDK